MLVAILTSMMISAVALMLAFPETPTGKWLHRILVEAPARFLSDFTWAKAGQALITLSIVMFLISIGPEGIALLTAAGVDAAMLEVMLTIWLVSVSRGAGSVWRGAERFVARSVQLVRTIVLPRNRQQSHRRRKLRPQRKDDDEPGWVFA
jgi:hypothetical protein